MTLDAITAGRMVDALTTSMTAVLRPFARSLQRTSADVWRNPDASGGKRGAVELHSAGILLHLAIPDARGLQLLADMGAERADRLAHLAYDADIAEGDELHIGDTVYQVERVARAPDKTRVAVWEIRS